VEKGYELESIENAPWTNFHPLTDILTWDYRRYPVGYFDVIAASPPCNVYSTAYNPRPRDFSQADALVEKTLEIINYFQPRLWWLENPRTGLLRNREVVKDLPYIDIDYCQFSDRGYKKPTRFWCCPEIAQLPSVLCDGETCPNLVVGDKGQLQHRELLGGKNMKFSPRQKGMIPPLVVDYLLSAGDFSKGLSGKNSPIPLDPEEWEIPERCCHLDNMLRINKVLSIENELQLLLRLQAFFPNGEGKQLRVLVDTGAQVNLVKNVVVPRHLARAPPRPIRLVAANGQCVLGGDRCFKLELNLQKRGTGQGGFQTLYLDGVFYLADIEVDAILSFPWLAENGLGVFPHHKALVLDNPNLIFLYGWDTRNQKRKMPKGKKKENSQRRIGGVSSDLHESPQRTLPTNPDPAEKILLDLQKMNLHLPLEGFDMQPKFLGKKELHTIARRLAESPAEDRLIYPIIQARDSGDVGDPRVAAFQGKIYKDFEGEVLGAEVPPDPPVRGPYGYAQIPLKEGAVPTRQKPFVLHGERFEAHKKVTQEWWDRKFVERLPKGTVSEWLSVTFVVPKKSGEWRGVVDMRGPNSQTRRVSYPLPVIEDLLVKQGGNMLFSILDLRQAFHQQPLEPKSRPITCCSTPLGLFQWRVNVMGLTNASQQFQQMMEDRLFPVRDVADPYIDDILVGTKVGPGEDLFAAHDKDLRRVLELMRKDKFVADKRKCRLFVKEVEFCGHVLGGGARRPSPGKLMAIEKWELPQTITGLRAFLGFTNYYSSYVKDYAQVVACLQDKLKVPRAEGKKGSKKRISWKPSDIEAFEKIKSLLCGELILQHVNPDKPFVLRVDASQYAVGATLEQLIGEDRAPTPEDVQVKRTVPVAFMSRKLTGSQRNWVPREQETYAIILALQKWESWIGLQPILVLTDHKALESWAKEVLDTPSGPIGRRARWHQILSKFDLSVGYIPGRENTIADLLSRWAYPASQALKDVSRHGSAQDTEEMRAIIQREKDEEANCLWLQLVDQPTTANTYIRGVTTRGGATTGSGDLE
jgi:hypothetical protein